MHINTHVYEYVILCMYIHIYRYLVLDGIGIKNLINEFSNFQ